MAVLTLTVKDDILRRVDELAPEPVSREELINGLIESYLSRKEDFESTCAYWNAWAEESGFTEEDLREEIRLYREEQRAIA